MSRRLAAMGAAIALSLNACGGEPGGMESRESAPTTLEAMELNPVIAHLQDTYGVNLLRAPWLLPEKQPVGSETIAIYKEHGKELGTDLAAEQLTNDLHNAQLFVGTRPPVDSPVEQALSGIDYAVTIQQNANHDFFVFGSMDSLRQSSPENNDMPFTTTLVDRQGKLTNNLTLLSPQAPFPFVLNSALDGSIFERQMAVCLNLIDVEVKIGQNGEMGESKPVDPASPVEAMGLLRSDLRTSVCESVGLATTARSSGISYEEYAFNGRLFYSIGRHTGARLPYIILSPELYAQLAV